jgi:acetyl esterase/lipase
VDGDTYDVPMQIRTVEAKRAAIYRIKFGDEASQKELSPVTHVARGKHIPPFLILHVAEHPDNTAQAQRLGAVLKEAGVPAKVFGAKETNHTRINAELGSPEDPATKELFAFVAEALQQ